MGRFFSVVALLAAAGAASATATEEAGKHSILRTVKHAGKIAHAHSHAASIKGTSPSTRP